MCKQEHKQKVGIFSGSFNPIHIGHLVLGSYMSEFTSLDEVWFVVSPHNPLKETEMLLNDDLRLEMVRTALEEYEKMHVSDVEFSMPRPSYTIDTLDLLSNQYPNKEFALIIGGDNWRQIDKWKNYKQLLSTYSIYIYPRMGEKVILPPELCDSVSVVEAPIVEVSSTFIRKNITLGRSMRAFLPPRVYEFITENSLYGYSPKIDK